MNNIKNKVMRALVLMAAGILCVSVNGSAETGLNANEQELIQFFQDGIDYNGKHYTIPSQYINQGINYLKQEGVDITSDQKSEVYGKVDEMAPDGVAQGYLISNEPTATPKPTSKPEDNSGENQQSQDNTNPSETDEPSDTPDSGSVTNENSNGNAGASNGTSGSKSIPELIETVKDLSDELGVKIAYDAADNNISVVNENGKTVMKAESTIKNTGYRLNQTFGITAGLFALVGICVHAARKYQLFAHDDET